VEPKGEFEVEPLHILDWKEIALRNRVVAQVKVKWKHFSLEEATWELEGDLQKYHPILFQERNEHRGQCFTEGGRDVTSQKKKIIFEI
jgi:predicted secreted Zn-dependent protease